jgi:hypothetical protein
MEILIIILATIAGTSVMTAFSYIASETFNKLWKEPVLLNLVVAKAKIDLSPNRKSIFGWIIHYVIGLAFVLCYQFIWTNSEIDPTWFCGLIFGIISGFIGILSWFLMFKILNDKPRIKFKQYYLQLFIAHIFFALTVIAVYKLFNYNQ